MNQLLAIKVFARVVESASFTRAAALLDMPKTTVSKLIQDLEAHLGTRLLQRTTRRLTLTPDGDTYYREAVRILRDLDDLDASFSGAREVPPTGRVRLDASATIARSVVIPRLADFHRRYPGIQVDLSVNDRPIDLVAEHVDCAIRGGTVEDPAAVVRQLAQAAWVTCASPGYLEGHGVPRHPLDVGFGHWLVGWRTAVGSPTVPMVFGRGAERHVFQGPWALCVNESNAKIAAGVAGLGIIQTFRFAVASYLVDGSLVPVLEGWEPPPYPFQVVLPSNRHISRRVRALTDWLRDVFADMA